MSHLYWHFLSLQHFLDQRVETQSADKKVTGRTYNGLQSELGFNDADYAPIRVASDRLSGEIKALDSKASEVRRADISFIAKDAQLKQLTEQRERVIQDEISFLKRSLPPDKISLFETFLVQFFAPKAAPNNHIK